MWSNHHPPSRPQVGATYPPPHQPPPHMNSYPNGHYPPRFRHDSSPGPTDWAKLAQSWMAQRTTTTSVEHGQSNYSLDSSIRHDFPEVPVLHGTPYVGHGHGQHSNPSSFHQRPPPPAAVTASVFSPSALHAPSRAPPYFRPNYHPPNSQLTYYPQQSEQLHGITHFSSDLSASILPAAKTDDTASHLPTSSHLHISSSVFPPENVLSEYNGPILSVPSHSSVQYGTFIPQAPIVGHFNPVSGSHSVANVDSVPIVFDHEHGNATGYPVPIKPNELEVIPPSMPAFDYNSFQHKDYPPTTTAQPGGGRRLPSWLRAELEKLESKKRQEQLSKASPDSETNGDVDDDNLNDTHGVVMRDAHESEDELSEAGSSPKQRRSLSPESQSAHSPAPILKNLSEEERMEEEMLFIRTTLTELLLETTKELLYDAARSAYNDARDAGLSAASHGSEHRMLTYSALKSIQYEVASDDGDGNESRVGGLVAYGSDDSDADTEDEDTIPLTQHKPSPSANVERERIEMVGSKSGIKDEDTARMGNSDSFVMRGRESDHLSLQHRYSSERQSPSPLAKVSPDDKFTKLRSSSERREDSEEFSQRSTKQIKRKHDHKSRDSQSRKSISPKRHSKRKKKHKHHSGSDSYSEAHNNHSTQRSRERGTSKRSDKSKHGKKQKKSKSHRHRSSSRSTSRSSLSRRYERQSKRHRS